MNLFTIRFAKRIYLLQSIFLRDYINVVCVSYRLHTFNGRLEDATDICLSHQRFCQWKKRTRKIELLRCQGHFVISFVMEMLAVISGGQWTSLGARLGSFDINRPKLSKKLVILCMMQLQSNRFTNTCPECPYRPVPAYKRDIYKSWVLKVHQIVAQTSHCLISDIQSN